MPIIDIMCGVQGILSACYSETWSKEQGLVRPRNPAEAIEDAIPHSTRLEQPNQKLGTIGDRLTSRKQIFTQIVMLLRGINWLRLKNVRSLTSIS